MAPGKNIVGFDPVDNAGSQWNEKEEKSSIMTSGDPQK